MAPFLLPGMSRIFAHFPVYPKRVYFQIKEIQTFLIATFLIRIEIRFLLFVVVYFVLLLIFFYFGSLFLSFCLGSLISNDNRKLKGEDAKIYLLITAWHPGD